MTTIKYILDGKENFSSINENLELKHKNLYLNDEKIFDIFRKDPNIINGVTIYNDIDITEEGRKLFDIPEKATSHVVNVQIN